MSKGFKIAHNIKDFVDGQVFLLKKRIKYQS